ncbi:MAG: cell division protein ZapA [Bacteroidales bacterium]
MDEKLSIQIWLGDREYKLKINREEEEKIRKTARLVNEKIKQYRQQFFAEGKIMQDWVAMACLFFALKENELQTNQDVSKHLKGFQSLDKKLEEYLDYAKEDNAIISA